MDQKDRLQRAVGFKAIGEKAKELLDTGASDIEIQAFVKGAKGELARQKPDWEAYAKSAAAAKMAQSTF